MDDLGVPPILGNLQLLKLKAFVAKKLKDDHNGPLNQLLKKDVSSCSPRATQPTFHLKPTQRFTPWNADLFIYAIICNHCKYSHVLTKDSNGVRTWIQTTLCTTVTNEKKCVSLEIHQMRSVNKICWKELERLSTGWCLGHPSEKYEFVSWDD